MKVCIGGTFDYFHEGHKKLIQEAIKTAGSNGYLFIGITTKKQTKTKQKVQKYREREKTVKEFAEKNGENVTIEIRPINDKYGPSTKEDFDTIVVSPETFKTAKEINQIRIKKGRKPLQIIKIPYVLAEDGKKISSTRIRNQEINKKGEVINHK